ncbi:MAG: prepilin-type N-terminal cleavage/methylation domain-containing protein [Synergistaceae bacterium]|nr:prepilin-type N-terminal cleavage/methylation domain-containing protein [Synergistaceae bacterium]
MMTKVKRGFSLVELFIAIVVMMILASAVTLNINSQRQTAKQEAEKLAAYLHDLMRQADKRHQNFTIDFVGDSTISWHWVSNTTPTITKLIYKKNPGKGDNPIVNPGFTVEKTYSNVSTATYDYTDNTMPMGTFTIKRDSDGEKYYVIIDSLGRVRTGSKAPSE